MPSLGGGCQENQEKTSVADPDPGYEAFLTMDPGSGIGFFLDPGFQTHIFDSLMTNFWVKRTRIVSVLAKKKFFTFSKIKSFTICGFKKW